MPHEPHIAVSGGKGMESARQPDGRGYLRPRWRDALVAIIFVSSLPGQRSVQAHDLQLSTESAHHVLSALGTPALTADEARRIAALPANKMIVRKVHSFDEAATQERFEAELLAAARGSAIPGKELFRFTRVKANLASVTATLARFENDEAANLSWIEERVQQFSPAGAPLHLQGFLIAGGNSTGFAWGGSDFYLNVAHFADAPEAMKVVMAHELYHAVQGAALAAHGEKHEFEADTLKLITDKAQRDRYVVGAFLDQLLDEGAATYVGDPLLLGGDSAYVKRELDRVQTMLRDPQKLISLLDMSLVSITADDPVDYHDVYGVGYHGPDQPLYYLGYIMAGAIVAKRGPARLSELILGRGCAFVQAYIALAEADPALRKLGDRTTGIVREICPI
jgi:hypothetical protein